MNKIKTIFDRDWEGNRGVIDKVIVEIPENAIATEKLDGTNVRLTIRNGILVRLEKRRNPSKLEKAKGIVSPWYVDADEYDKGNKWILEASRNTDLSDIPDGEWGGEAVGPKIQGNPLGKEKHIVVMFSVPSVRETLVRKDVPVEYGKVKEWLIANNPIEGIVWWLNGQPLGKIKVKDFK